MPKQVIQMETRICPGCNKEFKVSTTSGQIYHSQICENDHGGKAKKPKVNKRKPWESFEVDRIRHGEGTLKIPPPIEIPFVKPRPTASNEIALIVGPRQVALPPLSVKRDLPLLTVNDRQDYRQECPLVMIQVPEVKAEPEPERSAKSIARSI